MCAGLRIGELVALRWNNVDLTEGVVSVVEFSTYLGHDVVASSGKSRDAIRRVDIDRALVGVLRAQRAQQAKERLAADFYEETGHVFTRPAGGPYHPQYLSRLLGRYSEELGLPRLTAHGSGTLAQRSCSPMAWHRRSQLSGSGIRIRRCS